jgi:signal peptidase II
MASSRAGRPPGPLSSLGLITVCAVVAVDQATKLWATAVLPAGRAIDLLPILALLRVENTGIAFSIFAGSGVPLVLVTLVVTAAVIAFWLTARDGGQIAAAGFALILGGALGNLIDRVRLGYVIDFLWLHLGDRTLFVFNLADAALTLGPVLLLVTYLWPVRQPSAG